MIVRPDGDYLLLIRQHDHAALAADLLSWTADGVPARPSRDALLAATREHDCGWADEDDVPTVDPDTGTPWDFIRLPVERRQAVWTRAVRLLADRPAVAALVAHHAVAAYARYDGEPAWRDFFQGMAQQRDSRVADLATRASGRTFDSFLRDYASLRAVDLISLALCHGWQDRFEVDYYKGMPAGPDLTLTPDPFDGAAVPWRVPARRIARRPYRSDAELQSAVAAAPLEWLDGHVQGRPEPLPLMSRILVVEDDPDIAELLKHFLERASHEVHVLTQGQDAMPYLREVQPDLLILDRMLPGVDGLEICRLVRASTALADLPIMMVTARAEESDRIVGLELGADDYITKPFSAKEVVARVYALLRRSSRASGASTAVPVRAAGRVLQYGVIGMDLEQHLVTVEGRDVRLTAKEFLLLQYFLEHRGRVLSRDLMLTDVWGYQYTGGSRTVDVHVRRLREKIPPLTEAIETVKQFGYKLR